MEEMVHTLTMEERKRLVITACDEIQSFNQNEVILISKGTGVNIKGVMLKVEEVSKGSGEAVITGERIDSIGYSDNVKMKGEGFFRRMLK